jgi:hypothetical protein
MMQGVTVAGRFFLLHFLLLYCSRSLLQSRGTKAGYDSRVVILTFDPTRVKFCLYCLKTDGYNFYSRASSAV